MKSEFETLGLVFPKCSAGDLKTVSRVRLANSTIHSILNSSLLCKYFGSDTLLRVLEALKILKIHMHSHYTLQCSTSKKGQVHKKHKNRPGRLDGDLQSRKHWLLVPSLSDGRYKLPVCSPHWPWPVFWVALKAVTFKKSCLKKKKSCFSTKFRS